MSDRTNKRKQKQGIKKIIIKAKKDMADWVATQNGMVSERDMQVWQQGYMYGLNRGAGERE